MPLVLRSLRVHLRLACIRKILEYSTLHGELVQVSVEERKDPLRDTISMDRHCYRDRNAEREEKSNDSKREVSFGISGLRSQS